MKVKQAKDPKKVTCLNCLLHMEKDGIPETPKVEQKARGRKPWKKSVTEYEI